MRTDKHALNRHGRPPDSTVRRFAVRETTDADEMLKRSEPGLSRLGTPYMCCARYSLGWIIKLLKTILFIKRSRTIHIYPYNAKVIQNHINLPHR